MQASDILEDIIIFGSSAREKTQPADLDIALLCNRKDEQEIERTEQEIRKSLLGYKVDVTALTFKDIYAPVWTSIISEGWSVKKGNYLPALYDIQPARLYKYSISMFAPVQKVQFDRGLKAITEELKGIRLTRTVVLIPLQRSEQFEEFLRTWKIEFETKRYSLLPERQKTEKKFM